MGRYLQGDVILVSLSLDERSPAKTRPAIVVLEGADGEIRICPVSSKPPTDAPSVPISLADFSQGGLDLFGESYVMVARVRTLRSSEVIGKKGRLTQESFADIVSFLPGTASTDGSRKNSRGRRHSG